MPRTISLIQRARVASPCDVKWEDMTGDDVLRHCGQCDLNVYNFRNMTEEEANEILANAEGRICGQIWRRADGTVITRDCPVGLAAIRRRVCATAARIAAAAVLLCTAVAWGRAREEDGADRWQTAYGRTTERVESWLNGPIPPQTFTGGVIMTAPAPCPDETDSTDR